MTSFKVLLACVALLTTLTANRAATGTLSEKAGWGTLPELPQPSGGQMAGVSNHTLLVIGGSYFDKPIWEGGTKLWLDTVHALEPGTREWKPAGRLSHPLAYGAIDQASATFRDFAENRQPNGAPADFSYTLRAYTKNWLIHSMIQVDRLKI